MVLAAGFGTRLAPLTDELPKPLVPVGDRSVIAHLADQLMAAGLQRIVVNTHHLAEVFTAEHLGTLPLPAAVSHEPRILGTAGGVAKASALLGPGDVLVCNGDIIARLDLAGLLAHHVQSRAMVSLAVDMQPVGHGTVGLDANHRVVRLRGQRFGEEKAGADFAGYHVIAAEFRAQLPVEGCLVGDVYLPALKRGEFICGVPVVSGWTDIGTPRALLLANLDWLEHRKLEHFVAPGAQIGAQVELAHTVVCSNAVIQGRGKLERCLVLPNAQTRAPQADCLVLPSGCSLAEQRPTDCR